MLLAITFVFAAIEMAVVLVVVVKVVAFVTVLQFVVNMLTAEPANSLAAAAVVGPLVEVAVATMVVVPPPPSPLEELMNSMIVLMCSISIDSSAIKSCCFSTQMNRVYFFWVHVFSVAELLMHNHDNTIYHAAL